ncbi:helix-turn-helix domain-containing protein [Clostridium perfringens]|nr:helix-turn-helix domain-containing protein [Clostridium perfringens]
MNKKISKNEYLEFEKENFDFMDAESISLNRINWNVSILDLQNFYGNEYLDYRVIKTKKGKYIKVPKHKNNIEKTIKVNRKQERKANKFTDIEVKQQLELFNKIFNIEDNVFVRLLCKKTGEYYSYPVDALKDFNKLKSILNSNRFSLKEDLMYTFNTYNNLKSATEKDLHLLTGIAIDVDFGEVRRFSGKDPIDIINILERIEFNKTIPTPQIVEYGRNLRLIYALEKVPATVASKKLANRLAAIIGQRLADYGGDKQPLTTFGRVIGTTNSKGGQVIKVMYLNEEKYTLKELQEKYLEPLPEWYPEWKAKTNRKVINFGKNFNKYANYYKYNELRISDFYKIQAYFKEDGDCAGFRRFLCFQVRNHAILMGTSLREAEKLMKDFNNSFKKPLKWREIERDTRNVERKQYYYKSTTILNYIGITKEEEILLNLEGILSKQEKARRNNIRTKQSQKAKYRDQDGLTKTERKRLEEFIKIAQLELQGLSLRAIAKELGKSPSTLSEKINKTYDKINYKEILEEVQQGLYKNIRVIG